MRRAIAFLWMLGACGPGEGGGSLEECGPHGECPDGFLCSNDGLCNESGLVPAPVVTLTTSLGSLVRETDAVFTFSSDMVYARFACKLDGAAEEGCTPPHAVTVGEGSHTFTVVAVLGPKRSEPKSFSWTVDLTAPDTTLTDKPNDRTNSTTARFSFESEAGAEFRCRLDGAAWSPCTSPLQIADIAAGEHTFEVAAIDAVGNQDASPAQAVWTIDTTTPDTTLDNVPPPVTKETSATFTFRSNRSPVTFRCRLDGGAEVACDTPVTYTDLGEGPHTFTVVAVDEIGNRDVDPAVHEWTIDLTPPGAPTVDVSPVGPANDNAPVVSGSVEPGTTVRLFTTSCDGDPTAETVAVDGTFQFTTNVPDDSSTVFAVQAVDVAGNASGCALSAPYVEDSSGPTAPTVSVSPAGPANDNRPVVAGQATAGTTVRLYADATCAGAAVAETVAAGGAYSFQARVDDDTSSTFAVKAFDGLGNGSACVAAAPYVEDSTPPAAPGVTLSPTGPANNNNPHVFGTAEAGAIVQLWNVAGCAGPARDETSAIDGRFAFIADVTDDSSTTFSVRVVDAALNVSECQTLAAYVEDSSIPGVTITVSPTGPANRNDPVISGTAEAGTTVRFYANATCSGDPAQSAVADGAYSFTATVGDDTVTTFAVTATDAANQSSGCTAAAPYVEDSTSPVTPTTAVSPTGPANENNPQIAGTAETGATVRLYPNGTCTGAPVATTTAAASAYSFVQPVGDDSTTTFGVSATDAADNASGCASVTYVEDSAAPAVTATVTPAGPANDNNPAISGTAETGATVRLYLNGTCTGTPAATTTAAAHAYSFARTVTDDTTTTFGMTATDSANNTSACVVRTYVEDSTDPTVTVSVTPAGPANNNSPTVSGTTESGATVRLYTNGTCAGTPAATTTAVSNAYSFARTVTDDTTTTFGVTATDAASNTSACSTRAYVEDSSNPTVTMTLTPAGPADNNNPTVSGTTETGATVRLYTNGTCTGTPAALTTAAASAYSFARTVADNTTTTFGVTSTDAANNASGCVTRSYVEDSVDPTVTLSVTPGGPANNNNPTVAGTTETGATVRLYTNGTCTGTAAATTTAANNAFSFSPAVSDNTTTTFGVTATDAADNVSACATRAYVEDSAAPAVTATVTPAGPADNNNPTVSGTTETGATVRLYTNGTCTGTAAATTTAANSAYSFSPSVGDNTTTTFGVTATDAANNASGCVTRTYVEDSAGPTVTMNVSPAGPANNNSPTVSGTTETGATVRLYTNGTCAGTAAATTTAASNAYSFAPTVGDNTTTTFAVRATDAAMLNSACVTGTYVEDSAAPTVNVSVSPAGPANNNSPTVSGATETGATVRLYTNGTCTGTAAATATAANNAYSFARTVSDNTTTTFGVTATDTANNTSGCATRAYVEDSAGPTITVTARPSAVWPATEAAFLYTVSETPQAFTCKLDNDAAVACSSAGASYTGLSPGDHTLALTATDAAGNAGTATVTWTASLGRGHVVIIGHPYTNAEPATVDQLLINAVRLAPPSGVTGRIEAAIFTGGVGNTVETDHIRTVLQTSATVTPFPTTAGISAALVGRSVLIVPAQNTATAISLASAWGTTLRKFVQDGGVLIVLDGAGRGTGPLVQRAGLGAFTSGNTPNNASVDAFDPLATGIAGASYTPPSTSVSFYTDGIAAVVVYVLCQVGTCQLPSLVSHAVRRAVASFDVPGPGTWGGEGAWYWQQPEQPAAAGTVSAADAHDGRHGITNAGWWVRSDATLIPGARLSAWVRFPSSGGRVYLGFNANQSRISVAEVTQDGQTVTLAFGTKDWGYPANRFTQKTLAQAIPANTWLRAEVAAIAESDAWLLIYDEQGTLLDSLHYPQVYTTGPIGFWVSLGASVDGLTLTNGIEMIPNFGVNFGPPNLTHGAACAPGYLVTGIHGRAGEAIDAFGLHCGRIAPDPAAPDGYRIDPGPDVAAIGGPGGSPFDRTCGVGRVATGMVLWTATFQSSNTVYDIQLRCTRFDLDGMPGAPILQSIPPETQTAPISTRRGDLSYVDWILDCQDPRAFAGMGATVGPWPIYTGFTVVNWMFGFCRDFTP